MINLMQFNGYIVKDLFELEVGELIEWVTYLYFIQHKLFKKGRFYVILIQ